MYSWDIVVVTIKLLFSDKNACLMHVRVAYATLRGLRTKFFFFFFFSQETNFFFCIFFRPTPPEGAVESTGISCNRLYVQENGEIILKKGEIKKNY